MQNICVFIGANTGNANKYKEDTICLGQEIAKQGLTLVYGGANVGLMGILADTVLHNGGKVIGIMPQSSILSEEIAHQQLTKLYLVESMQARKLLMAKLADAFIALPGGLGTLEEFFEVWNAIKIGQLQKPIGMLNINSYFEHLLNFLNHSMTQGFLNKEHIELIRVSEDPINLLQELRKANLT